jgi:hypothetical protein
MPWMIDDGQGKVIVFNQQLKNKYKSTAHFCLGDDLDEVYIYTKQLVLAFARWDWD